MRRVVITGIGAVSPNGIGRERFWEATKNGVSGVRRIRRFDPTGYQVQVAGEVPDEFDEKRYVDVKDRPHVSPLRVHSSLVFLGRFRGAVSCYPLDWAPIAF